VKLGDSVTGKRRALIDYGSKIYSWKIYGWKIYGGDEYGRKNYSWQSGLSLTVASVSQEDHR
jgi:hypothetical protein